jgi:molybdate transport system substrate-binding protein
MFRKSAENGATMAEIKILSSTAIKTSLDELVTGFEQSTGHKIVMSFGPSARIVKQVGGGDETDLAIATDRGIDDLIANGRIVAGTRTDLARSAMALAVQAGARKPDISTAEKFKTAMLGAKSLGMSNPVGGGQSGANLVKIFERLGIAEAMKPKCFYGPGGPAGLIGNFLVRKEIEIGIQQLPELMAVPDIDIVGPLPPDIQMASVFSAGISTAAKNADGTKALLAYLTTPAAKAVYRSKGMDA